MKTPFARVRSFLFSFLAAALLAGCITSSETGRRAFILTSEGEEAQLGAQAFQEMAAKEPRSTNQRWTAILERVGSRIAAAANRPGFKWEFRLVDSKEKNAYCLPGGKVAFYTGIFPIAQNEAGLAAIMGHEVAHATERHGGQRISMAMGTQVGLAGLSAILGGGGSSEKNLLLAALGVGSQVGVMLPFSRGNESEADEVGLRFMARAGYDPHEAPKIWERMARDSGGGPPTFLSTHPSSAGRRDALQRQIPAVMPLYERSPKYGVGETL